MKISKEDLLLNEHLTTSQIRHIGNSPLSFFEVDEYFNVNCKNLYNCKNCTFSNNLYCCINCAECNDCNNCRECFKTYNSSFCSSCIEVTRSYNSYRCRYSDRLDNCTRCDWSLACSNLQNVVSVCGMKALSY
jgi:hypothetical protein